MPVHRLSILWAAVSSASFAQAPPPPQAQMQLAAKFFSALPSRFPADDLSAFDRYVADDVQVYRGDKLIHQTRKSWVDAFQAVRSSKPNGPQGYSISRGPYYLLSDGGIMIMEFTYPIAPEGAQVVYHPSNPLAPVSYYFSESELVRVVYGTPMRSFAGLCQMVEKAKAERTGEAKSSSDGVCG